MQSKKDVFVRLVFHFSFPILNVSFINRLFGKADGVTEIPNRTKLISMRMSESNKMHIHVKRVIALLKRVARPAYCMVDNKHYDQ